MCSGHFLGLVRHMFALLFGKMTIYLLHYPQTDRVFIKAQKAVLSTTFFPSCQNMEATENAPQNNLHAHLKCIYIRNEE